MRRLAVLGVLGVLGGCTLLNDTSDLTGGALPEGSDAARPGDAGRDAVVNEAAADVSDASIPFLALDRFLRELPNGLGFADVGGAWSASGASTTFSVTGGVARLRLLAASAAPVMMLGSVLSDDVDVQLVFGSEFVGGGPPSSMRSSRPTGAASSPCS